MSEREDWPQPCPYCGDRGPGCCAARYAFGRPADDEGLVEMAAQEMQRVAYGRDERVPPTDFGYSLARAALAVYRAHDPARREMREALEAARADIARAATRIGFKPDVMASVVMIDAILRKYNPEKPE